MKDIVSRKLLGPLRVFWIILPIVIIALVVLGLATAKQLQVLKTREEQLAQVLATKQARAEKWHQVFSKEKEIIQRRQFIQRVLRYPDLWIGAFW
jgi:hypothetical protein